MATAKKAPAKKAPAKKAPVKKAAAKKAAPAKKVAARKAVAKKAAPAKRVPAKSRTPNAAFMKAMTPSAALAAIIGARPLPRTEVTKKVWEYIKKNNLADSARGNAVQLNAALRKVVKKGGTGDDPGPSITRWALMKKISNNLK